MPLNKSLALGATLLVAGACNSDDISGTTGPNNVVIDFCGFAPGWFAVQNQGGAWQRVDADVNGVVRFNATDKVSVAFSFAEFGVFQTAIVNTTAAELNAGIDCGAGFGNRSLTGTANGLSGSQVGRLFVADQSNGVDASAPSFAFDLLPNGPLDLVAFRNATFFTNPPDRVIVRRAIPSSTTNLSLDFAAAEAVPLSSGVITLANMGNDFGSVATDFLSAAGTFAQVAELTVSNGTSLVAYYGIPAALLQQNDLHALSVFASAAVGTRSYSRYFTTPIDRTVTMGPHVNAPTLNQVATSPYLRMRAVLAAQPDYPTAAEVAFVQSGTNFRAVDIITTASFLGGAPSSWEFTVPDFSGTGYQSSWGLQPNVAVDWEATGYQAGGDAFFAAPTDGQTLISAVRNSGSTSVQAFGSGRRPGFPRFGLPRSMAARTGP